MNDKIDFAVTWVDGNDPIWLLEKSQYQPKKGNDSSNTRYRDYETVKYFFRSVEKYAPWVNKVYFITYGHLPKWLNTDNPKLVIVKHEDFIPNEYLPTFNSCAIEMNIHRIKDISNNIVYFNDDMLLTNNTKDIDFYKDNKPCDSAILNAIIPYGKSNFEHRLVNNANVINRNFNLMESIKQNKLKWFNLKYGKDLTRNFLLLPWKKVSCLKCYHVPYSIQKDTFIKLWDKEKDVMEITCQDKFRSFYGVNPWVLQWWQIMSGNFYPRSYKFGILYEMDDEVNNLDKLLFNKKYKSICINDSSDIKNFNYTKRKMTEILNKKYPEKSSFEK